MSSATSDIKLVSYKSIHEIDESHWDSIVSNSNLFHTHRFIKTVEDAAINDTTYTYLLFYVENKLIASTVLCSFIVSLDLLTTGFFKKMILSIRLLFPNFLKIKTLFCGLPVSLGQNNLVIAEPGYSREISKALNEEMSQICKSEGIRFQCVKEFLERDCLIMDDLIEYGFFRVYSLPYISMDIRWDNFQDYLNNLRHHYRRSIKISLKKMEQVEPVIHKSGSFATSEQSPRLILYKPKTFSAKIFYELYDQVMNNIEFKLETLNELFFESLYINLECDLEVLAMESNDHIIGAAIVTVKDRTMTFILVGLNYDALAKYDVYFNLVFGIISLAIDRGCNQLNLGQTSYWFKQRIGGVYEHEYFYFKADNWYLHKLIESFQQLIFPKFEFRRPNVFRD